MGERERVVRVGAAATTGEGCDGQQQEQKIKKQTNNKVPNRKMPSQGLKVSART